MGPTHLGRPCPRLRKRKNFSPSEGYGESGGTFLLVYRANVVIPTLKGLMENAMPYLNFIPFNVHTLRTFSVNLCD